MKTRLLLTMYFVCVVPITQCAAQEFFFGPVAGMYFPYESGNNRITLNSANPQDIIILSATDRKRDGEFVAGIFVGRQMRERITLRADLSFFRSYSSFNVYNATNINCTLCTDVKHITVGRSTVELLPALRFTILKSKKMSLTALAGGAFHLQLKQRNINFTNTNWAPGVAEVANALDDTPKDLVFYLNYGVSINYSRLSASGRFQENAGRSYVNDINVDGSTYGFNVRNRYLTLTLSYSMYGMKMKGKKIPQN